MAARYTERLRGLAALQLPVEEPWARNVYWMYGVVVDEATGLDAAELRRRLRGHGVETRPFFLGMHEQPVFHALGPVRRRVVPGRRAPRTPGAVPPSGTALTDAQIDGSATRVDEVLA